MERIVLVHRRQGSLRKIPTDLRGNGYLLEFQTLFDRILLIAGFSKKVVIEETRKKGGCPFFLEIPFLPGVYFYVAIFGFDVLSTERVKSHSPGSQAIYYARAFVEPEYGILIQYLPPHSETSTHYHVHRQEIIIGLCGRGLVVTPKETGMLWNNGFLIEKREVHQTQTVNLPLVTVIITQGVAGLDDILTGDHHFNKVLGA